MSRRAQGLTLIELIVALAVFAVLGTLSYRGVAQLADSRARLGTDLERWRAVERALNVIETELLQVAAPLPIAAAVPVLESRRSGGGSELQLLSLSSGDAPRRVAFRHDGGRLEWLRWPGRDVREPAAIDPLLDAVVAVRWRFLGAGGWLERWPASSAGANDLPSGIELQLDLDGIGTVTRLYALR